MRPARPARRTTPGAGSAPATPRISETFDTSPSDTPNTAARAEPRWTSRCWCSMPAWWSPRVAATGQPYRPPTGTTTVHRYREAAMTRVGEITRHDLDRDYLAALLDGEPSYRVGQVWDGLYQRLREPSEMTDLPKALRVRLDEALPRALTPVTASESDGGDTVKWLWALPDGAQIETVVMAYRERVTVCVSSQAGCAMACGFCATGQAGFERHLTAGEMVEQVVVAARWSHDRERRLSNVVFMG